MDDEEYRKAASDRVGANPAYIALNEQVMQAIEDAGNARQEMFNAEKGPEKSMAHGKWLSAERRYRMLNEAADALCDTLFRLELG